MPWEEFTIKQQTALRASWQTDGFREELLHDADRKRRPSADTRLVVIDGLPYNVTRDEWDMVCRRAQKRCDFLMGL